MEAKLTLIQTPYIDAQTLLSLLSDYRKPRDWIARMVKKGDLIRLKNGLYLIREKIQSGTNTIIPYEQIANILYGPSYVSLEWALSFYGMIPEGVKTVTNMTLGKPKEFHTPIGDFSYYALPSQSYSIGVTQKETVGFVGSFLIATPEKALADLVFRTCKGMEKDELKKDLLESRRIDREALLKLDKNLLADIRQAYRSKSVRHLVELIGAI